MKSIILYEWDRARDHPQDGSVARDTRNPVAQEASGLSRQTLAAPAIGT